MREILFRGKRADCEEWVEGDLIQAFYGVLNGNQLTACSIMPHTPTAYCWRIDPETVGQYTGLSDRNGVRIFEGDIVKGISYSAERIGVIVWIDEISSFGVRYFKSQNSTAWENSSILRCSSMGKTDEFTVEIIGNIHDNPELLEGGEVE